MIKFSSHVPALIIVKKMTVMKTMEVQVSVTWFRVCILAGLYVLNVSSNFLLIPREKKLCF